MTDAKERVRKHWSSVGDAYVTGGGFATAADLQRMVDLAKPEPHEVLLDIATGGGHVARVFAPFVSRVIVSDLVPEMLVHAEQHLINSGVGNYEVLVADAEALPLPDASVDIVTCRIAPHHFPDPAAFVAETHRVLKPGGRFVLVDSTVDDGEIGAAFNAIEKLRDATHVRALSVQEWINLLSNAGYTVSLHESYSKRHDFQDWISRARMPESDRQTLEFMLQAPELQIPHAVERGADGSVIAFSDTKTLFLAYRR